MLCVRRNFQASMNRISKVGRELTIQTSLPCKSNNVLTEEQMVQVD
ncbi:hypothetical protein ES332_A08G142000v1 [Gossypium tomentosum]|uniref:Uncharacterized protein n=1 Tax=Gossypium tomentosum TaxID=34277 RepID=A0A5D2PEE6_GOSTO|nr:hypothetical protein ES332_A08G142000v1 [Gossypium tomentosum]